MIRVAILGASGYSALELIKLLLRHPQVEITALTTRQTEATAGRRSASVARRPARPATGKPLAEPGGRAGRLRVLLLAAWGERGGRRRTAAARQESRRPQRRLPAQRRGRVRKVVRRRASRPARMPTEPSTACRSCIATRSRRRRSSPTRAAIRRRRSWPSRRCLEAGAIAPDGIIIDSKSGVSGAGREPKPHLHFPECNESVSAYGVGTHRHMPEIDQVLSDVAGTRRPRRLHAAPDSDGPRHPHDVLRQPTDEFDDKSLLAILQEFYADEPFVRVSTSLPSTKHVAGTNFCDITVRSVRGRVVIQRDRQPRLKAPPAQRCRTST